MNKRFNWGFWIVVSLIVFAAGTFIMVYISMSSNVDLVADDYYEKELQYQQHIDVVKSTNALEKQLGFEFTPVSLTMKFPPLGDHSQYTGTVFFFRPSEKKYDFSTEVKIDSLYSQTVSTSSMLKGFWRVKVSWNVGSQEYYYEQPIIIQ